MRILGISGSLRKASFNTGLLRYAAGVLPRGHSLEIFGLDGLPLFNEDVEAEGAPAAAQALRDAIEEADALLFATPEYNYGMSGVLKNAIDWASRPYPDERPSGDEAPPGDGIYRIPACPLTGKPAAMMGASAGIGGTIRSQLQLRQALQINSCLPLAQPEVFVTFGYAGKFNPGTGDLLDEQGQNYVRGLLAALVDWAQVARLPGADERPRAAAELHAAVGGAAG